MRFNEKAKQSYKDKKITKVVTEAHSKMRASQEEALMHAENDIINRVNGIKKERCPECDGDGETSQGLPCKKCSSFGFVWAVREEGDIEVIRQIEDKYGISEIASSKMFEKRTGILQEKGLRAKDPKGSSGETPNFIKDSEGTLKERCRCYRCGGDGRNDDGYECPQCKGFGHIWEVVGISDNNSEESANDGGDVSIVAGSGSMILLEQKLVGLEEWAKEALKYEPLDKVGVAAWYSSFYGSNVTESGVADCYGVEPDHQTGNCYGCPLRGPCSRVLYEEKGIFSISKDKAVLVDTKAAFWGYYEKTPPPKAVYQKVVDDGDLSIEWGSNWLYPAVKKENGAWEGSCVFCDHSILWRYPMGGGSAVPWSVCCSRCGKYTGLYLPSGEEKVDEPVVRDVEKQKKTWAGAQWVDEPLMKLEIPHNSVGSQQLKPRSVGYEKISHRAVRKEHLSMNALEKIRDYLVEAGYAVGVNSIDSAELVEAAVNGEHLSENALGRVHRHVLADKGTLNFIKAVVKKEFENSISGIAPASIEADHLSDDLAAYLTLQVAGSDVLALLVADKVEEAMQETHPGKKTKQHQMEKRIVVLEKQLKEEPQEALMLPSSAEDAIRVYQEAMGYSERFMDRMERMMELQYEEGEEYEEEVDEEVAAPVDNAMATVELNKQFKMSANLKKVGTFILWLLLFGSVVAVLYPSMKPIVKQFLQSLGLF